MIISLLLEVSVDLTLLKNSLPSGEIKDDLNFSLQRIDVIGCELTQNIAKILNEKVKD